VKVLVVGDIMLDRYVWVETHRQAPEASIPVWDELREEYRLGGAANVANNLKAIGDDEVQVHLAGIFRQTQVNQALIHRAGVDTTLCNHGVGMVKNRYVEGEKIIFRSDSIRMFDPAAVSIFEEQFRFLLRGQSFDAVIISDYAKGTVTSRITDMLRMTPTGPVVVDSKRQDLRIFERFQVLKVNSEEHGIQASMERIHYGSRCVESLFDYVVVTRGGEGADLLQCEQVKSNQRRSLVHRFNFPVEHVDVKDVTGCGDTHTAALTFSMLKNSGDMMAAVKFANACARSVVQKFGTSVPTHPTPTSPA
jgi:rfaE bifunctional protein kinase chain/domain